MWVSPPLVVFAVGAVVIPDTGFASTSALVVAFVVVAGFAAAKFEPAEVVGVTVVVLDCGAIFSTLPLPATGELEDTGVVLLTLAVSELETGAVAAVLPLAAVIIVLTGGKAEALT